MAFTNETAVRNHTGLVDTDVVSSTVIQQAVDDAHAAIMIDLDPVYTESQDSVLKLAETELSSAFLLRSLASAMAGAGRDFWSIHIRSRPIGTPRDLERIADQEEKRARGRLAKFLAGPPESFGFELAEPKKPTDED